MGEIEESAAGVVDHDSSMSDAGRCYHRNSEARRYGGISTSFGKSPQTLILEMLEDWQELFSTGNSRVLELELMHLLAAHRYAAFGCGKVAAENATGIGAAYFSAESHADMLASRGEARVMQSKGEREFWTMASRRVAQFRKLALRRGSDFLLALECQGQ